MARQVSRRSRPVRPECQGAGGAHQRQVAAQPVGAQVHAQLRCKGARAIGYLHVAEAFAPGHYAFAHFVVFLFPVLGKGLRVLFKGIAALDHFYPFVQRAGGFYFDRQAEAV